MAGYDHDSRIVMTLDAGGTSFRFSAMRGNKRITGIVTTTSNGDNLKKCLANLIAGFTEIRRQCPRPPVAISFAFPGPADYPAGIIGDLPNLVAFRGGVALGPMLEHTFRIPVTINNDGELFAYGEAIAGFLPYVNDMLKKAGSPKRYKNLFGVTLGTGFGGGITRNGELFAGDNSNASQIWLTRHKFLPKANVEEGVSIRAVRRVYAEEAQIPIADAPDPRLIEQIALGEAPGHRPAAVEAYRRLGEVAGNAMGNALALIDGLAVIGGGLSKGWRLFLPPLIAEMNESYIAPNGETFRRLPQPAFNLEDPVQLKKFLKGETRSIAVPGSKRKIEYDSLQRIGVGISRLGTSEAIAIGAYAFALRKLDNRR
ncbi:MAG TPA: ROK family protein [Candidatus Acidoferrales bacterium]|jgi:glucokinase|nr:ROK family protein [Candidatus Acidoferrales bacterium]